jgi:hypothetical protein
MSAALHEANEEVIIAESPYEKLLPPFPDANMRSCIALVLECSGQGSKDPREVAAVQERT